MSEDSYYNKKNLIGCIVNTIYDIQKERINFGNRIFSIVNPEITKEDSEEKSDKLINVILKEKRVIDEIIEKENLTTKRFFKNKEITKEYIIKDELLYNFVENYITLLGIEENLTKSLGKELKEIPIYNQFLINVKGCGVLMSGVIIAYLDIYKSECPTSFLRYIGIDVVEVKDNNGEIHYEGRSKKHTVMKKYVDKNGKESEKVSITFKPFLKTKIMGVLSSSFIKCKSQYTSYYYNKKEELKNTRGEELTLLHIDNMAKRYMMKKFVIDLWLNWREAEGLPINSKKYGEE